MIELFNYLSIFGLAFLIKESYIFSGIRNFLLRNEHVGSIFYRLFDCWFCIGCHSGWIVYLLSQNQYSISSFILWILFGGTISLILGKGIEN